MASQAELTSGAMMRRHLTAALYWRWWATFLLMGVSLVLFGLTSLNLFFLFRANINLFLDYGTMVIAEGALRQLAELIAYGYLSLTFYLVFKACEHVLVERMCKRRTPVARGIG